jgi:hypothetical protein
MPLNASPTPRNMILEDSLGLVVLADDHVTRRPVGDLTRYNSPRDTSLGSRWLLSLVAFRRHHRRLGPKTNSGTEVELEWCHKRSCP